MAPTYEIYVINMPAETARLAHMATCLAALDLPMTRIEATTPATCEAIAAEIGFDLGDREIWSGTERAVFTSHVVAWKALLDSGRDWAVVMEDDVFLSKDAKAAIETIAQHSDAGLVRLETFGRTRCIVDRRPSHGVGFSAAGAPYKGFALFGFHGGAVGAAGYMIHRRAVQDMLNAGLRLDEPIDLQFFAHPIPKGLKQAVVWPAVVVQSDRLHESVWPAGCGWEEAMETPTFVSSIAHSPVEPDRSDETIAGRLGKLRASIARKFTGRVRRVVPLSKAGPFLPAPSGGATRPAAADGGKPLSTPNLPEQGP